MLISVALFATLAIVFLVFAIIEYNKDYSKLYAQTEATIYNYRINKNSQVKSTTNFGDLRIVDVDDKYDIYALYTYTVSNNKYYGEYLYKSVDYIKQAENEGKLLTERANKFNIYYEIANPSVSSRFNMGNNLSIILFIATFVMIMFSFMSYATQGNFVSYSYGNNIYI